MMLFLNIPDNWSLIIAPIFWRAWIASFAAFASSLICSLSAILSFTVIPLSFLLSENILDTDFSFRPSFFLSSLTSDSLSTSSASSYTLDPCKYASALLYTVSFVAFLSFDFAITPSSSFIILSLEAFWPLVVMDAGTISPSSVISNGPLSSKVILPYLSVRLPSSMSNLPEEFFCLYVASPFSSMLVIIAGAPETNTRSPTSMLSSMSFIGKSSSIGFNAIEDCAL